MNENQLPKGWKREEVVRKKGVHLGRKDIYVTSPGGKIFRSKKELQKYIDEKKLKLKIEQFYFSSKKVIKADLENRHSSEEASDMHNSKSSDSTNSISETSSERSTCTSNSVEDDNTFASDTVCSISTPLSSSKSDSEENICRDIENPQDYNTSLSISLLNNEWVSDDIIQIYFENFANKVTKNDICFLSPVVSQAIKSLNDYEFIVAPLHLSEKTYVFIPINNAEASLQVSGSHWSLLFFSKPDKSFYYFDSVRQSNLGSAQQISAKLSKCIDTEKFSFTIVDCPKQQNTYDCGVYLLLFTDWLIKGILEHDVTKLVMHSKDTLKITCSDVMLKRASLAYLVMNRHNPQVTAKAIQDMFELNLPYPKTHTKAETACKAINTDEIYYEEKKNANNTLETEKNETDKVLKDSSVTKVHTREPWTKVKNNRKRSPPQHKVFDKQSAPIPLGNKYGVLGCQEVNNESRKLYTTNETKKGNINTKSMPCKTDQNVKHSHSVSVASTKFKINLYCDSQGRDLGEILQKCSNDRIRVSTTLMPNATTEEVYENAKKADSSPCVVICGTNDLLKNTTDDILEKLENNLKTISLKSPICLTTIPYRHDINNNNDQLHEKSAILNNYITELAIRIHNVHVIDLNVLRRFHFTQHGLHLNLRGKRKLSYLIIDYLKRLQSGSIHHESRQTQNGKIKIVDTHMRQVIDQLEGENKNAFSHCISADFGSERHMSAGVATVFKEKFGRPSAWDCISNYLAHQNGRSGAGVYSLITKPEYHLKPTTEDYDKAFEDLISDFQKRGYEHLICSPLGCVRDKININHFATNILKFQQATGASVTIVSYFQKSYRKLRGGLSHEDFQEQLYESISNEYITEATQCESSKFSVESMSDFPPLMTSTVVSHNNSTVKPDNSSTTALNSSPCLTPDNGSTAMNDTTNVNTVNDLSNRVNSSPESRLDSSFLMVGKETNPIT